MMSRATQSELLEQRIAENTVSQETDLAMWIFDRVHVPPSSHVLELCCGTGGQTLPLLQRVGDAGRVVALDISRSALDTLASKVEVVTPKLTLVQASLDNISPQLHDARFHPGVFDLIFCAYGLYYSSDAARTLQECRSWLKPEGRIVVVGPFGPNNWPLFDLVRRAGAVIGEAVLDSSERFMLQTVLPWGVRNFAEVAVHTMVNPVRWTTPERVMNYWRNTTFYDEQRQPALEQLLHSHFANHDVFINEKWVMLLEMSRGR